MTALTKAFTPGAKTADPARFAKSEEALVQTFEQGRQQTSKLVREWLQLNNWTYQTVESLVKEQSTKVGLVHGSQLSNLIAGKLEPKPQFFVGLANLNKYTVGIYEASYQTVQEGNRTWTAGDFMEFFCGLKSTPTEWVGTTFTIQQVRAYCRGLELNFKELRDRQPAANTSTSELLAGLTQSVVPKRLAELTQKVIVGLYEPTPEEFTKMILVLGPSWGLYLQTRLTPYSLLRSCRYYTNLPFQR